ncbi:hypothetical protein QUA20_02900 [Microcoleus sp. Pol7_A1]|uniref:hypothetical protein n=1 Tax=Microcoleus sp. Pol7_A1 TaxID=2818893 RepID=UPI002FCE9827
MLLDHRTRTLAPGVVSTISTSGDLLFLAHNGNAPKISLNNFWYSFSISLTDGKISPNSIQMCLPEPIASNIFPVLSP